LPFQDTSSRPDKDQPSLARSIRFSTGSSLSKRRRRMFLGMPGLWDLCSGWKDGRVERRTFRGWVGGEGEGVEGLGVGVTGLNGGHVDDYVL
jgi:hypothetical protein